MKIEKNAYIKRITNFLLNILIFLFGIILLISIYTGVQTKILGNSYTNFFGYSIFEVQTGSMAGAVDAGDWIIVKLTKDVKLNDIITFKSNSGYITHRVIEVYKGTYVTKGDANNAKDAPIDRSQIVGKVSRILPNFGILRKTIFNPAVLIALIITLFFFNYASKKETNKESKILKIFKNPKFNKVRIYILNLLDKIREMLVRLLKRIIKFLKSKKINMVDKESVPTDVEKIEEKVEEDIEYLDDEANDYQVDTTADNYNDDELAKTSLYRVISVDSLEVDDRFKVNETVVDQEEEKSVIDAEEDLDKTSLYSVIPVDLSEINDTFLEIAENEVNKQEVEKDHNFKVESANDNVEEEVEDENLTKINLDSLKKKRGSKGKNVIDSVLFIKKEEINELIGFFIDESKIYTSKATIKDAYMNSYIEAKYYNLCANHDEFMTKSGLLKIDKVIDNTTQDLLKKASNNAKYSSTVALYGSMFELIDLLEKAKDSITDLKAKREYYKKVILKAFKDLSNTNIDKTVDKVIKLQKKYKSMIEYFLRSFDTNTFILNKKRLDNKKDMYFSSLEHNINFSKVYSDYIIDKTYSDGIVAEDKVMIMLTLLSVQLVRDMFSADFNKKYLFCIPSSLYGKEKKFEKLLKLVDDQYVMENIVILISPKDLFNNLRFIKQIKKMGYKFAVFFDKDINLREKDRSSIYIMDYVFINKKSVDSSKILPFIPEDLSNKVIYENLDNDDENFWGDKV